MVHEWARMNANETPMSAGAQIAVTKNIDLSDVFALKQRNISNS